MTEIYVDGSADNTNKSRPSYTSVWVPGQPGIIKVSLAKTNNEAEYLAVIEGIRTAEVMRLSGRITIVSDSLLVVSQLKGEWKCKEARLQFLKDKTLRAARIVPEATFEFRWCRREVNQAGIEMDKFNRANKERDA